MPVPGTLPVVAVALPSSPMWSSGAAASGRQGLIRLADDGFGAERWALARVINENALQAGAAGAARLGGWGRNRVRTI